MGDRTSTQRNGTAYGLTTPKRNLCTTSPTLAPAGAPEEGEPSGVRHLRRAALLFLLSMAAYTLVLSAHPTRASAASSPQLIRAIHFARNETWKFQRKIGTCCRPYGHTAERTTSHAYQEWVLRLWKYHWRFARMRYLHMLKSSFGVPSWFVSDMSCISDHEEYGMDGPNTSAGYFGLVYPPSGYIDPGPTIARIYGDSWLDVPLSAQLGLAYSLEQHYGWSPWTTAPGCGL